MSWRCNRSPSTMGGFDLIADDVGECHLGHLTQEVGGFRTPVTEGRAEAVWHCIDCHAVHDSGQRHVRKLPARVVQKRAARSIPSAEDRAAVSTLHRTADSMIAADLHAGTRNTPDAGLHVDLAVPGATDVAERAAVWSITPPQARRASRRPALYCSWRHRVTMRCVGCETPARRRSLSPPRCSPLPFSRKPRASP